MKKLFNRAICFIIGHKKYSPQVLGDNNILQLKDSLGQSLVKINVCERCGKVYSTFG